MTPTPWDPGSDVDGGVSAARRPGRAAGMTVAVWDPGAYGDDDLGLWAAGGVVSVARRRVAPGVGMVNAAFVERPARGERPA